MTAMSKLSNMFYRPFALEYLPKFLSTDLGYLSANMISLADCPVLNQKTGQLTLVVAQLPEGDRLDVV